MVTERLLLLGNLALMHQPDQNFQSTLARSGKEQSWAALNFQEQSGLPFHRRVSGRFVLGPCKTPMAFAPPQIRSFILCYEANPSRRLNDAASARAAFQKEKTGS
jgi:hypothetical protein